MGTRSSGRGGPRRRPRSRCRLHPRPAGVARLRRTSGRGSPSLASGLRGFESGGESDELRGRPRHPHGERAFLCSQVTPRALCVPARDRHGAASRRSPRACPGRRVLWQRTPSTAWNCCDRTSPSSSCRRSVSCRAFPPAGASWRCSAGAGPEATWSCADVTRSRSFFSDGDEGTAASSMQAGRSWCRAARWSCSRFFVRCSWPGSTRGCSRGTAARSTRRGERGAGFAGPLFRGRGAALRAWWREDGPLASFPDRRRTSCSAHARRNGAWRQAHLGTHTTRLASANEMKKPGRSTPRLFLGLFTRRSRA